LTSAGFYQLGKIVSDKIRSYADNRQIKDLNEIFMIMIHIGNKMIYREYGIIDQYLLDEAVNQIAEDILISIQKHPDRYVGKFDNFYPYFKYVLKSRMGRVVADFYEFRKDIVCLDEYDEESLLYREFITPYDLLNRDNRFEFFIGRIYSKIRACPRFKYKARYLVWPMIVSLFLEDKNVLFDSLGFRDRTGLRMLLASIDNEKSYIAGYL
jgi:hypothetical protein